MICTKPAAQKYAALRGFLWKKTNRLLKKENLLLQSFSRPEAFFAPVFAALPMRPPKPASLNRKLPPPVHEPGGLVLPRPELSHLDNGMPLYVLDFPDQEIVKIELVFRAGRPEEEKRLVARAAARMLREGTATRTGAEIAETIDFYGGTLSIPASLDMANFQLFSLKKYAPALLPVFAELFRTPSFPERELDTFRENHIAELLVELEKPEVRAYRELTERIFGADHPYGYNSTPDDYRALTRDDLTAHFGRWFTADNGCLFASGRIDADLRASLNEQFGKIISRAQPPESRLPAAGAATPGRVALTHPGSLQTAIKIGRRLFARRHPDFDGMFVLNTLLGGYFGSRLMMNIREKRGYTYNIYSSADTLLHDGYLYIATEVNPGKAAATIREIFAEMRRLCETPVDADELDMVRNYLLGVLLNGLDGPMNVSEMVRNLVVDELPWEAFERLVATIRSITPGQLQALAARYLQPDDFWVVTVG